MKNVRTKKTTHKLAESSSIFTTQAPVNSAASPHSDKVRFHPTLQTPRGSNLFNSFLQFRHQGILRFYSHSSCQPYLRPQRLQLPPDRLHLWIVLAVIAKNTSNWASVTGNPSIPRSNPDFLPRLPHLPKCPPE